jgi:uncharacterized Zn finger protein (UPF0148 family)
MSDTCPRCGTSDWYIRPDGQRECRACKRRRHADWYSVGDRRAVESKRYRAKQREIIRELQRDVAALWRFGAVYDGPVEEGK